MGIMGFLSKELERNVAHITLDGQSIITGFYCYLSNA